MTDPSHNLERVSIELTNRCFKACSFCYNASSPQGSLYWQTHEVIDFVRDCATNGIKAVSFGGGEPLQHEGIFDILWSLKGCLFRSITTNGLLLDQHLNDLVLAAPDKVHVSIHFPEDTTEVTRVIDQVHHLADRGIRSGVNFLVARSKLETCKQAANMVRESGISNDRIVYLPMRIADTPTPNEVSSVAGEKAFQSMSCLAACAASPRFCSISADGMVGWCSYTQMRRRLQGFRYPDLIDALTDLGLSFCGGTDGN